MKERRAESTPETERCMAAAARAAVLLSWLLRLLVWGRMGWEGFGYGRWGYGGTHNKSVYSHRAPSYRLTERRRGSGSWREKSSGLTAM